MAICEEGLNFKARTRQDFVNASNQILELIHTQLFKDAIFVKQPQPLEFYFRHSGKSLRVGPLFRVIELEEEDLLELENYRFPPGALRGEYNPDYGKVILNRKIWCMETLYHEFLHATSSSSYNKLLSMKYVNFYEGLTELFSGYLMKKTTPRCYDQCWRIDKESSCYRIYERDVKIWLGLCHFIPFTYTFSFYFYSDKFDFKEKWGNFIENIHNYGYPKFRNIIDDNKKPLWLALHQECNKNFGKEYLKIYDDLINPIDLSLLNH
jgi:hypothetical protein